MKFLLKRPDSILRIKVIFLLCLFLSFSFFSFAQDESNDDLDFVSIQQSKRSKIFSNELSNVSFKISFLTPTVGIEFKLADRFSLELAGKLNFVIGASSGPSPQSLPKLYFFPRPVAHFEPKWNYNIVKRLDKNKNVKGFSSNFLSLYASYRIKVSPITFNALLIGPTWGIQRTFKNIGYFKLNTGLGYLHLFDKPAGSPNYNPIPVMPIIDVQLGLIF